MSLTNTIGIDKIDLQTTDFGVKKIDRSIFGINSNTKQGGSELPIYSDLTGNKIEANGYYHNGKIASYNVNKHGLMISFNPSNKYHPFNLISTGTQLNDVIESVKSEMSEIGILANIETAKLTRVDVTRNAILNNPFQTYMPSLRLLKGKRQSNTEYPDGYLIKNKQHQTIFYDKSLKLQIDKAPVIIPTNMARGEVRATKNKSVNRHFEINNLSDLLETAPDQINSFYKDYLNSIIFKRVDFGEQSVIDFESEIKLYHTLKKQRPKGYFNDWLQICSIDTLLKLFGSIRGIEMFLIECGESRMTIHRNIKRINDLIQIRGMMSNIRKELTPSEMLHELQIKLTA